MGEIVVAILHIYGVRAISLLFCNHQDTESEKWEMEIGVAGPIFTHKKSKGSMGQLYSYYTIREKNIVSIIHIYGARSILILFYDNQVSYTLTS